ncbi:MAG: hypothetical protein JSS14_21775 [Proteobacteria bacterium]|nr:hypothetical protein [Pseudomonadota bacterium]
MHANFLLGSLSYTEAAIKALGRVPLDLIARHAVNDHGKLYLHEVRANRESMVTCGQIISRYPIDPCDLTQGNVMVITPKGWGETVVQLENE